MQNIFIVMQYNNYGSSSVHKVFSTWGEAQSYISFQKRFNNNEYWIREEVIEKWKIDE